MCACVCVVSSAATYTYLYAYMATHDSYVHSELTACPPCVDIYTCADSMDAIKCSGFIQQSKPLLHYVCSPILLINETDASSTQHKIMVC